MEKEMPIGYLDKRGLLDCGWNEKPQKACRHVDDRENTTGGCQACLYLATGEPVIRCLEDGLFLGIYEAVFHSALAQPLLSHR